MPSPADRFTRLEKIAVFLIAMGEARAREILADFDLATIEQINDTIGFLGEITPQEKAAIMIEFGDFFYKDKPLSSKLHDAPAKKPKAAGQKGSPMASASQKKKVQQASAANEANSASGPSAAEQAAADALDKLKSNAGKIDWSKAGYDFGDGFKGASGEGRR